MSNELVLNLRIRANADGTAQVIGQTSDGINRISKESASAAQHLSDMGGKAVTASQRIVDGMSRASDATQKTTQSARTAANTIDAGMASAASSTVKASGALRSMESAAGSMASSLSRSNSAIKSADDLTNAYIAKLEKQIVLHGKSASEILRYEASLLGTTKAQHAHINELLNTITSQEKALANTETASKGVVSVMGMLRAAVPIAVLAGLGKEAFDANREFQSLRTSLASSVGGAENAKIAFGFVQDFAAKTPYDVEQVTESFIRLKNLGLSPSEEALRSYGNTAASQSKPLMQMIEAVADASVGEFERLKEFGIKASQVNGKVAFTFQGVTTTVANNAGEIQKYLINLGNSKFGDAMAGQSKTINGALSNLGDTWKAFMDRLADDNQENAIAKWVTNAGNAIHWLDVQINGAVTNADKLAEIDRRIGANQKSLNAHNANGWVGGLIDDLSGYDAQLKKNQIESDTKAREQLVKAMGAQKSAQDALIGSMANSTNATNASSEAIKKEIESLNDQHKKLSLSERDYELAKLSALGMSEVEKKIAIGIWDTNHALEEKTKRNKEAESATKSLQGAYDNAANALGQAIAAIGSHTRSEAMEYEVTAGALKHLSEAQKLYLLQQAAIFDNKTLEKSAADAAKAALDSLIDKYNQLTMSARAYYEATLKTKDGVPLSPELKAPIMAQYDKNVAATSAKATIDESRSALESYNKALDDARAKTSDLQSVTSAVFDGALGGVNLLAGAFDKLVGSIETTTREHERLNAVRAQIDAFQPDINKGTEQYLKDVKTKSDAEKKYASDVSKLNEQTTLNQLSGARQIAGAMSQMFAENTKARQAMHNVEMTLAAIEMAMSAKKIALEIGGYLESTVAHTASVAPFVAGEAVKGEAAAATAVAEQATSGPFIGFGMMAAMAVAMGALGFLSGGKVTSPGPQGLSPDSGTVLGDSSAKSQSIDKTYQLLKDIQAQNYPVLKSIDAGISNLHDSIANVVTKAFQAGGITPVNVPATQALTGVASIAKDVIGSIGMAASSLYALNSTLGGMTIAALSGTSLAMGALTGLATGGIGLVVGFVLDKLGITDWLMNGLFGGKKEYDVVANGIATRPTSLGSMINNGDLGAAQWTQIETKTSGGWFGKDKFSFDNYYTELDAKTKKALNDVFTGMGSTMLGLADALGHGLDERVNNYVIPGLMINLKGLNAEDASKKVTDVLSTTLDTMATDIFGGIVGQYQQMGEGMLETTVRIVSEIAVVKEAAARVGQTITGDVMAISDAVVQASGGIKEFQKQFDSFYTHFYSAADQQKLLTSQLSAQLNGVNLALPATRDGYKGLISALDLSNEADQQRYTLLLKLSDAADGYYKYIEEAASRQRSLEIDYYSVAGRAVDALNTKRADELAALRLTGDVIAVNYQEMIYAAQDAAKTRGLEISLMEAQGRSIEAVALKRQQELAALSASDQAIQKQIYAAQDLTKANQDLAAAQKTAADAASTALDRSLQRLQVAVNAEKSLLDKKYKDDTTALKDQLDTTLKANATQKQSASDLVNSLTSIAGKIRTAIGSTVVETAALDRQRRLSAQAVLQSALDLAKSGGSLVNFVGLDQALTDIAKPSEQLFASFEDYARDQGRTAVVISSLADHADSQVSVAQATLNAIGSAAEDAQRNYDAQYKLLTETYQSDTARLDQIVSSARAQIDALKGIDNSVLSVATALDRFAAAIGVANQTTLNVKNQSLQDRINAGVAPTFNEGWVGNSPFKLIYQSSGGATYSKGTDTIQLTTGGSVTAAEARKFVNDALAVGNPASVYAAATQNGFSAASLDALMGWDAGTSNAWASANKLPSFAVGVNYVPNDMVANIHQGERILPAADNRELMMRLSEPGRNDEALIAVIERLEKTVAELKSELEQIKKNTSDTERNTRETSNVLGKVTLGSDKVRTTPA